MKISEKRHAELYRSISNPITDFRIKHVMGDIKDLDEELRALEFRIYKEIKEALRLTRVK